MKHNLKSLCTAALFLCIFSNVHAIGAGVQTGIKPIIFINENGSCTSGLTGTLVGTVKFNRVPVSLGGGFEAGNACLLAANDNKAFTPDLVYGFTIFADYNIIDLQIKNTWNFYSGLGLGTGLLTKNLIDWNIYADARIFTGMNWLFFDNYIELFTQLNVIPTYQKNIKSNFKKAVFTLAFPIEAGFRIHF